MGLASGARLGPYEIRSALGAGGMGEVYRALDTRLGREVAIKILPESFARDGDRLHRFELEARTVAALNHPNILALFDIGTHDGSPYTVSELLEGETLRQRLEQGPLPARRAVEFALQVSQGLAAAHEKGVVHRDVKPENIFLTKDGRVKILDFGLAKLAGPESAASGSDSPTLGGAAQTSPGMVMGTAGYMSPEQVRGKPIDPRSDIFSFGAVVYEMLAGKRAFQGETSADTLTAILQQDPSELTQSGLQVSPALDRIVRRCLEKEASDRFQGARDLGYALDAVMGSSASTSAAPAAVVRKKTPNLRLLLTIISLVAILALAAVAWLLTRRAPPPLNYVALTFRRGNISRARFAPDGQTVVYSAAWDGAPPEIFSVHKSPADSRALLANAMLMAVSNTGELAVIAQPKIPEWNSALGTVGSLPMAGGRPREILENIRDADWSPEGTGLAVVRMVGRECQVEFPPGKSLFRTSGYISDLRFSRDGRRLAFLHHPIDGDDRGDVVVVDLQGRASTISTNWESTQGLAWSADGTELWFSATASGGRYSIYAATLAGKVREILRAPARVRIQDVAPDGRMLITRDDMRAGVVALTPDGKEHELSVSEFAGDPIMSRDGATLIFTDWSEAAGSDYGLTLSKLDGSPAVQLGKGVAEGISDDGKWVLALLPGPPSRLMLLPAGAGQPRELPRGTIDGYGAKGSWFHDGKRVAFNAHLPGKPSQIFLQDLSGGDPRPISPDALVSVHAGISPDDAQILAYNAERTLVLAPISGGPPRPVAGIHADDSPAGWSTDPAHLYVVVTGTLNPELYQVNVLTGERKLLRKITPADTAGLYLFRGNSTVTADGRTLAYECDRSLDQLFIAEPSR